MRQVIDFSIFPPWFVHLSNPRVREIIGLVGGIVQAVVVSITSGKGAISYDLSLERGLAKLLIFDLIS